MNERDIRKRIDEICMITSDYADSFQEELETLYKQLNKITNTGNKNEK